MLPVDEVGVPALNETACPNRPKRPPLNVNAEVTEALKVSEFAVVINEGVG